MLFSEDIIFLQVRLVIRLREHDLNETNMDNVGYLSHCTTDYATGLEWHNLSMAVKMMMIMMETFHSNSI